MTANGIARFGDDYSDALELINELNQRTQDDGGNHTSLLEPPETTSSKSSDHTYRGRFMAGKEEEYEKTIEAYQAIAAGRSSNHVHALESCRKFATFKRDLATGDIKVFGDSCRDRWCPMCAGEKAAYAKDQSEIYIKSLKAPRFLTLTLRNNEADLKTQIAFLTESFARLRSRAYWKKNVTGGIWFLQVKRGRDSELWHPHLHILLDGNYMEQGRLSALWELVTYGSPVIDIRRIHDVESAARYVARYTARPAALQDMPIEDAMEVISALHGKRLCGTFGNGKTVTLTPPKIEASGEWNIIGGYDDIAKKAETCPKARAIMIAYNTYQPLSEADFEAFTGHPVGFISQMSEDKPPDQQMLLDFYN